MKECYKEFKKLYNNLDAKYCQLCVVMKIHSYLKYKAMIDEAPKVKKEKNPETESQKIIDNHQKAAMHHETAAFLHHEAAKYQLAGNNTMACGCNCKAKDQTDLAVKAQKKNKKKHTKIA